MDLEEVHALAVGSARNPLRRPQTLVVQQGLRGKAGERVFQAERAAPDPVSLVRRVC